MCNKLAIITRLINYLANVLQMGFNPTPVKPKVIGYANDLAPKAKRIIQVAHD